MTDEDSEQYKAYKSKRLFSVPGWNYKRCDTNDDVVVDLVDYHVDTLP